MNLTRTLLIVSFILNVMLSRAFACTNFVITAKDGSIINARSMEFAVDLKSNLRSSVRDRVFKTTIADGATSLSWSAKYGYLYLDGMDVDMTTDGMNEKGLSFGALYLPGIAQYQVAAPSQNAKALPYYNIGDWILSNFATMLLPCASCTVKCNGNIS